MKKLLFLSVVICLFSIFILLDINATDEIIEGMQTLQRAHIEANVPDNKDFDKFLTRDLESFFSEKFNKTINIKYEMLRNGLTQTGVAYPKYYLWVKVFNKSFLIIEGAARVAAVEKTHFDILHFLSKGEINKNTQNITDIFPQSLLEIIILKAK